MAGAKPKWRIVLVSHGDLAQGMLDAVEQLMGKQENIAAYGIRIGEKMSALVGVLQKEIDSCGADNILFLTDMVYGTPFNAVVSLTKEQPLYHITGMNLTLALSAVIERGRPGSDMQSICRKAVESAEKSIIDVRSLLKSLENGEES